MKYDLLEAISQSHSTISDYYLTGLNKILIAIFGISFSANYLITNSNAILIYIAMVSGILLLLTNLIKAINAFYEGKLTGKWIKDFIKYIQKMKCL